MLVFKVWWLNRDKQLREGQGEHEKGKNSVWFKCPTIFVRDCRYIMVYVKMVSIDTWVTDVTDGIKSTLVIKNPPKD